MNRARVLFVDDEVSVLDGLRNLLYKDRQRWDMVFALGGEQALAEMQRQPFQVVVSDMRMPGMDGGEFLARVMERYPETARIVLSGHADRAALFRAMHVAHQFLSKPCGVGAIRAAIDRSLGVSVLVHNRALQAAVGGIEKLPSVPSAFTELTAIAADPTKGARDLAAIVSADPSMTAKLLQLVNSAYFGISQRITSIQQAVAYLGIELLKSLALTANVFAAMEEKHVPGFSLERVQERSLIAAQLAKRFVPGGVCAEESFTAGLLHDLGTIILALRFPAQFEAVTLLERETHKARHIIENEILGFGHEHLGAYLLGVWGLPLSIVEAVAYHRQPSLSAEGPREVLVAVHVAVAFTDAVQFGHASRENSAPPDMEANLDLAFLQRQGVLGHLPRWRSMADEVLRNATDRETQDERT
jgi:HD-like signal output (HDOD) protein/CheY-like chemotaxis protein